MWQHSLMFIVSLATISTITCVSWLVSYPFYVLLSLVGISAKTPRSHHVGSILHKFGAQMLLWSCGIKVHVTKSSQKSFAQFEKRNVIYIFNHTCNLDPFIMTSALPANTRFIYKKELGYVPLLGCALAAAGHIAINRENREKAVNSLNKAEDYLLAPISAGGSVGIAPEGTRSRSGELIVPFKKGPFHIAKNTRAVIIPLIVRGGHHILPPGKTKLQPTVVNVKMLQPVDPSQFQNVDDLKDHCEKLMVEGSKAENWNPSGDEGDKLLTNADLPWSASPLFPIVVMIGLWYFWKYSFAYVSLYLS